MNTQKQDTYIIYAWAIIIGFTLFRLFYSGLFLLIPDETNYWQWSRHLAFGYHDGAPMIAWIIRLSTTLFGQSEISVRLPSVLSMFFVSAYLIVFAKRWFNSRIAFYTVILSQGLLTICGLLATYDSLQLLSWTGACYHVARAYENGKWSQWLWAGFWFGFGMLSKYTIGLFLPGVLIFGLVSKDHRNRLASIRPYTGLLIGSLMFFPVIYWNMINDWNSVRHVAHIGGANQGFTFSIQYFGEYLAGQAGMISPFIFILVLLAWYYAFFKNKHNWVLTYLLWTSFPMFAFFAIFSLHSRVEVNWPNPAYVSALVLVAALFAKSDDNDPFLKKAGKLWPVAVGTAYLLTAILLLHVVFMILPIPVKTDRVALEVRGWDVLGKKTGEVFDTMPDKEKTFIFGLEYQMASELAFYTPGQPQTVSINKWKRPNPYDYWWNDADLLGMDAVGVTKDSNDHQSLLKEVFHHVDQPVQLKIYNKPSLFNRKEDTPLHVYYIYRAFGFKGGLRWVPKDTSDIRAR